MKSKELCLLTAEVFEISYTKKKLSVTATKSGGTLIYNDNRYDLITGKDFVVDFEKFI